MFNSLAEKEISFKELEKKVFKHVCELGCEITKMILETYDDELAKQRERKSYRDKGKRKNNIKLWEIGKSAHKTLHIDKNLQ